VFEKKLKAFNLAVLLAEGEEDIRQGNVESADEFMKDLKKCAKLQVPPAMPHNPRSG
jgi:hypothetical protein